jgi:hypothetical protein
VVKRVIVGGRYLIVYSLSYYGNAVGAVYRLLASVSGNTILWDTNMPCLLYRSYSRCRRFKEQVLP